MLRHQFRNRVDSLSDMPEDSQDQAFQNVDEALIKLDALRISQMDDMTLEGIFQGLRTLELEGQNAALARYAGDVGAIPKITSILVNVGPRQERIALTCITCLAVLIGDCEDNGERLIKADVMTTLAQVLNKNSNNQSVVGKFSQSLTKHQKIREMLIARGVSQDLISK